jgi:hypothetical protein
MVRFVDDPHRFQPVHAGRAPHRFRFGATRHPHTEWPTGMPMSPKQVLPVANAADQHS